MEEDYFDNISPVSRIAYWARCRKYSVNRFLSAGGRTPLLEVWDQMGQSEWEAFVHAWLAELHVVPFKPDADVFMSVKMMQYTAAPEHQWRFIRAGNYRACHSLEYMEKKQKVCHLPGVERGKVPSSIFFPGR